MPSPPSPPPTLPSCSRPRRQIAADYADRRPLVIGTLKGAVVFLSDLVRAIDPLPPGLEVRGPIGFALCASQKGCTSSSRASCASRGGLQAPLLLQGTDVLQHVPLPMPLPRTSSPSAQP